MAGLREEKKRIVRENILAAAREIFENEGYGAATTKKIARKAAIGEGTIYNHFKSKSEILLALYNESFKSFREQGTAITTIPGKKAKEYLQDFFNHYFKEIKTVSKEWLRELFLMIYQGNREAGLSYQKLEETDELVLVKLREYLEELKKLKIIPSEVELPPLIEVIYALFMLHYSRYTIVEEMEFDEFIPPLFQAVSYTLDKFLT